MDEPNPFRDDFSTPPPSNPYAATTEQVPVAPGDWAPAKIMAPAIALLIVGLLGIAVSIFSIWIALTFTPEELIDPNADELMQQFQGGAAGPGAALVQAGFAILNLFIIAGAICMMRLRYWGVGLAASIAAIVNVGSCCCLLGLPTGIWSIVILSLGDVRHLFAMARQQRMTQTTQMTIE